MAITELVVDSSASVSTALRVMVRLVSAAAPPAHPGHAADDVRTTIRYDADISADRKKERYFLVLMVQLFYLSLIHI